MIDLLKHEALIHGDKLQIIPLKRLQNLKEEINFFSKNEELNGFQKWIVDNKYVFELPEAEFEIKSIIITAIPHSSYAKVEFMRRGKKYNFASLVMSDFENTEKYLKQYLEPRNYHLKAAPDLPMKRLAVSSGMAVYGRNNICYIEKMGSFFSFAAYFSDLPCDNEEWIEVQQADICKKCSICLNSCPTEAIRKDRFLIDNERCLSYFNEGPGEFPKWLPLSAHHCLYDCLKCQINCPMNKEYVNNVMEHIEFNEEETSMLISGNPFETFPESLKQKSRMLGLDQWLYAIPRNLKLLFEISDSTVLR